MIFNGGGGHVRRLQDSYIEQFNKSGAIDSEHAVSIDQIRIKRTYIFSKMVQRGVFKECVNGRFYIDNQEGINYKARRRKIVLFLTLVLLFIFILLVFTIIR